MTSHLLSLIIIYVFFNAYVVWFVFRNINKTTCRCFIIILFFTLFLIAQLLGPIGDHILFPSTRSQFHIENFINISDYFSYVAVGIFVCIFIYTATIDALSLFLNINRSHGKVDHSRRKFMCIGIATVGTAVIGIHQANAGPQVHRVDIKLRNLPHIFDRLKIVQVSDLHIGPLIKADYVSSVVQTVNSLEPDVIVLTGDFFDGLVDDLKIDTAPLAELKAKTGIYFITGNHEYYWDTSAWINEVTRLGAQVLLNEHVVLRRGEHGLVLAGVTDYSTLSKDVMNPSNAEEAFEGSPWGYVRILLAHNPASYEMAYDAGCNLLISGHTHAGQFFPFSMLAGLFHRYYKGLNRHGDMWIYVNSGTGYWGPPFRTGVPSEITQISLRSSSD